MLICDECGFDAARWSASDLERTVAHADDLVGRVTTGWTGAPVEPALEPMDDPVAAAHAVMHRVDRLATLRRTSDPFEPMHGTVASIQRSGGGVPKSSVPTVEVDAGGIIGDVQGNRLHHGRPWQAICLYSSELLAALAADGHPITAGSVGENLTVSGLDWGRLRGGLTIAVGDVRLRTTVPTTPCQKIAASFADRRWSRIDHAHHPGWSRWYASVLRGGTIHTGDEVRVTS